MPQNIEFNEEMCVDQQISESHPIKGIIQFVNTTHVMLKDGRWFHNPSIISTITREHLLSTR